MEIEGLKKKLLELSEITAASRVEKHSVGTFTEHHEVARIIIPISEKKKEVKFDLGDLGDASNKFAGNQNLRDKLCRLSCNISKCCQTGSRQESSGEHTEEDE